ncbi:alpha/beta hydrolase family protein [Paenibacillus agaridevorans]|uniref:alpha/beta hydrolase family protein n=1 Tax=Paenibacillus agaridevorans TaxID=171404 RepID=UPI001BE4CA48|nr:acetylxylan esterase [Paenibacillus agaridevorans]
MLISELESYRLRMYQVKEQWKRQVYERSEQAFRAGEEQRDLIETHAELKSRQAAIRDGFLQCIGGLPPSDSPLLPKECGVLQQQGFRIEKVVFQSRPGIWVTCNVYVPDGRSEPGPAVLFLCGHHDEAKHAEEYQSVCRQLVHAGLVVLAMDPIGQGERLQHGDGNGGSIVGIGVREHDYLGSQCLPLGDCLARYFVHDAMRAIDYMITRPDVDAGRIGVTGNSGGGTQTAMVMMADSRIAAAAPATFIMSRQSFMYAGRSQDAEQIWPGFTAKGFDHEDILLAIAPKPLLVLAVSYDFFPIEGTLRTFGRVKRFWEMHGKEKQIRLFVDEALHAYTPALGEAAAEFFLRHLGGRGAASIVAPSDEQLNTSQLLCMSTGQVLSEPGLEVPARTTHSEIAVRSKQLRAKREAAAALKEVGLYWLKERVYDGRKPVPFRPRCFMQQDSVGQLNFYNAVWWSQEGIFNHGIVFKEQGRGEERLPATLAIWEGGTHDLQRHWDWISRTCRSGRSVIVLDTTGSGPLQPHLIDGKDPLDFYEIMHKLSTDSFWLGDSVAALRTYDVIRAVKAAATLPGVDGKQLQVYASGRHGLYAQLASAIRPNFPTWEWEDALESIASWVESDHYKSRDILSIVLPGMLRYFDLPDLRKWSQEE